MTNKITALGFTLIELLITISLVAILSSLGIASYIDFSRRQTVYQAAKKIVQDLRLAQSLASNNQKPNNGPCGTLEGYTFVVPGSLCTGNLNCYDINVNCINQSYTLNPFKRDTIPSDLQLTGFTQVKFKVLRQSVECNPCTLTVSGFGKSKTIIVNPGGAIKIEGE